MPVYIVSWALFCKKFIYINALIYKKGECRLFVCLHKTLEQLAWFQPSLTVEPGNEDNKCFMGYTIGMIFE